MAWRAHPVDVRPSVPAVDFSQVLEAADVLRKIRAAPGGDEAIERITFLAFAHGMKLLRHFLKG